MSPQTDVSEQNGGERIVHAFVDLPDTVRVYLVQELRLSRKLAEPVVHAAEVGLDELLSPLRGTGNYFEKIGVYNGLRRGVKDMWHLLHETSEEQYEIAALVILPYALQM